MNTRKELLNNVNNLVNDLNGNGDYDDAYDLLEDCLNVETLCYYAHNKEFKGAVVTWCTGGPHIEIDTTSNTVKGYWGNYSFERNYDDNLGFNETIEELYYLN